MYILFLYNDFPVWWVTKFTTSTLRQAKVALPKCPHLHATNFGED